jgi:hypothetical protein
MKRKMMDNDLQNIGRNSYIENNHSLSSRLGQGGYLNILLELTGISSEGDRTGMNNRYNNNNRNNNNSNNDNSNYDNNHVPLKIKMSDTNTDGNSNTDKLDIHNMNKNTNNHESRNQYDQKIPNTNRGKTKNNNQNSDPNFALEILCSQTKLAKLLVKEIDFQLKC